MTEIDDLETFIRQQKEKLAKERQVIENSPRNNLKPERKTWEKAPSQNQIIFERPETPEERGLPFEGYTYEEKRHRLQEEKKQEYNALLSDLAPQSRQIATPDHVGLRLGDYAEKRKQLQQERHHEYNAYISKHEPSSRRPLQTQETHVGLPMGQYEEERKQLDRERQLEYRALLQRQQQQLATPAPPTRVSLAWQDTSPQSLPQTAAQNPNTERSPVRNPATMRYKENIPPRPETPEIPLVQKLGSHEDKRKKLNEERKKEYNKLMSDYNVRRPGDLNNLPDDFKASLPGMEVSSAQERKKIDQQQEYRQFLERQRQEQEELRRGGPTKPYSTDRQRAYLDEYADYMAYRGQAALSPAYRVNRLLHGKDGEYIASLPGLQDHASAELRKLHERNREYNDFLQHKKDRERSRSQNAVRADDAEDEDLQSFLQDRAAGPRKGWATPTYDEILEKKRREERNYRRNEDPDLYDGYGLRSSRSESHLNRDFDDRRFRDLDHEYESKRVRFREETSLLDPESEFSNWLARLRMKYNSDYVGGLANKTKERRSRSRGARSPPPSREPPPPPFIPGLAPAPAPAQGTSYSAPAKQPMQGRRPQRDGEYNATLMIGGDVNASADQRRKAAYRHDLEQQMQEAKGLKDIERKEDARVNALPSRGSDPRGRPAYPAQSPHPAQPPMVRETDYRTPPRQGILENGLGLYHPSLLSQPPPGGLMQAAGQPGLGPYNTALDDAYYYYGMRNPLDPGLAGAPPMGLAPPRGVYDNQPPVQRPPAANNTPRVTFDNRPRELTAPRTAAEEQSPFIGSAPQQGNPQTDAKKAYQEELQAQIEQQKIKKQREKQEKDRYERKLEEDIKNYDPFGRGGGGAPMRDTQGNIIANRKQAADAQPNQQPTDRLTSLNADLRNMHDDNQDRLMNSYKSPPSSFRQPPPNLDASQPSGPGGGAEAPTHARGGHGIFGEGLSDAEKNTRSKYQDELRRQIEEKKMQQELEKKRQREEDERLLQKIEEDNRKMQEELENEKRKDREKHEAAQRQQDELRRQQEDKKKEEEKRRREVDDKHQDSLRKQEDDRRRERQRETQTADKATENRLKSPPVPTHATSEAQQELPRGTSPPVPTLRKKSDPPPSPPVPAQRTQSRQSRVSSSDVLSQLARMRQQLQSERKRVETDLNQERDRPEVYDPRTQRRPSAAQKHNVDIFEVARNREPVTVRRPPSQFGGPHQKDFKDLKNKNMTPDSEAFKEETEVSLPPTPLSEDSRSRQDFRNLFPDSPATNDALETQQRVLLMQQERELKNLRNPSPYEKALPKMNPKDLGLLREGSVVSAALLDSESAFIDVPEGSSLPSSGRQTRNDSARSRRRNHDRSRLDTPKSDFGSVVSLDPDKITQKNEDRLRKLKTLAGDDISTGDPDDILSRFMAKQQHARPPSGNTLQDESWLRPGTMNTDR